MKATKKLTVIILLLLGTVLLFQVHGSNIKFPPTNVMTTENIELPATIILDTLSGNHFDSGKWIIQLKPNPFSDAIRVKSTQKSEPFAWSIKTIDGSEIARKEHIQVETKLNITYLPSGLYILELSNETYLSTVQLIKY